MSPTSKQHISSPDCWCKPKVTTNGGNQIIEHKREVKDDPRKTD
jgi:hypothetical protein